MQGNILRAGRSLAGHCLAGILFSLALLVPPGAAQAQAKVAETYFKKSYALLIGNDVYGNGWPHLKNGVADAEAMAAELARHGFHTVVKRNLRRRELLDALEKFFIETGSDPEARLLVWFSGHGHTVSGHGHTVNGEGYLVPSGAPGPDNDVRFRQGAVSVREFGRLMREARAQHALAILDSCFSGTVFTGTRGSLRALPPPVQKMIEQPVRQMISSGEAGELVSDNGRFRELIVEALSARQAAADLGQDGYILGSNLGQFLFEQVSRETGGRQNPQYGKLNDTKYNRGDFVFRTLPPEVGGLESPPPEPVRPPVTRQPTLVDWAVDGIVREAVRAHDLLGTPLSAVLVLLVGFCWTWRGNERLLLQLQPGTPGMNEEIEIVWRAALQAETYRQRLKDWLEWVSTKLGGPDAWSPDAYTWLFNLAIAYPIVGIVLA